MMARDRDYIRLPKDGFEPLEKIILTRVNTAFDKDAYAIIDITMQRGANFDDLDFLVTYLSTMQSNIVSAICDFLRDEQSVIDRCFLKGEETKA